MNNFIPHIFSIKDAKTFNELTLEIFKFQSENNLVYKEYLNHLNISPKQIDQIEKIPFLPIDFFKTKRIISNNEKEEVIFTSSGTTGKFTSKHFVTNVSIYEESFSKGFEHFYGNIKNLCVLALLPSYLEREGSSLIYMMEELIIRSKIKHSGFYLNNISELVEKLEWLDQKKQKTLLIGVTYALLDLAKKNPMKLNHTIVMETGGMKGQRKEITRNELHNFLTKSLGVSEIHSEYGMTELLSQAYSKGNGIFYTPPWMKLLIRDIYDPFDYVNIGQSGGINIIDLANINSCCFIETKDLGKINKDGSFEVLGRIDNSDVRGCNLLI